MQLRAIYDAATGQVLTDLAVIHDFAGDPAAAEICRRDAALAHSRVTQAQKEAARRLSAALVRPADQRWNAYADTTT